MREWQYNEDKYQVQESTRYACALRQPSRTTTGSLLLSAGRSVLAAELLPLLHASFIERVKVVPSIGLDRRLLEKIG